MGKGSRGFSAVGVAVMLAVVGLQAVSTASASASTRTAPSGRELVPAVASLRSALRLAGGRAFTMTRQGSASTQSVTPPSTFTPSCYGDSKPVTSVGGTFDPSSYGAFYSCTQSEWSFVVQTSDSWSTANFGDWSVFINTDGDLADTSGTNCGGVNYLVGVGQDSSGQDQGVFEQFDGACNVIQQQTNLPFALSGNSATVSVPASLLSGTALAWLGQLQSRTQEESSASPPPGDCVPSSNCSSVTFDSVESPSPNCTDSVASGSQTVTTKNSASAAAALRRAGLSNVRDFHNGYVSFTGSTASAQQALSDAGISARVSPNHNFSLESVPVSNPNDPAYTAGDQWNLGAIGAQGAWSVTNGNNVVVADIDTGVDYNQPDLSANLLNGFDETTGAAMGPGTSEPGQQDSEGHGTEVAGVIAAVTNNSVGVASLGFNTKVLPVKVAFGNSNTSAEIASGITWAATHGAQVINLSLGDTCTDAAIQTAIQNAQAAGILVVAAAGNGALSPVLDPADGTGDQPSFPADLPGVMAVGATGHDGFRAFYSNTGSYVSVAAPGGSADGTSSDDMVLLWPSSGLTNTSPGPIPGTATGAGTSFAAPEVAATAALIWAVNPNLTANQVSQLITGTASDTGVPGRDTEYGAGVLNASVALADTPQPEGSPATAAYGTFKSIPPARILDTRRGIGAPQAQVGPGGSIALTVTGSGGVPASGVAAVVLNVTATNATNSSYVTVWPNGQARPLSSNLNFSANQTVPNLVTVKVGTGGSVSLFNSQGQVDLVADVAGYFVDDTAPAPESRFEPITPVRLLDTRTTGGPITAGTARTLIVAGQGNIPSDATAVVANVTVTQPVSVGYLTLYPDGITRPTASNLNFVAGETVPNEAIVQLGSDGAVDIYANGTAQVVVDVQGYFTAAGSSSGSRFFPVVNHRILDTRSNVGGIYGPIGAGQSAVVPVVGQGGVIDGASSVVINTTATGPTATSYLTVYPGGPTRPVVSDLNFTSGETVANLVNVPLPITGGSTGEVEMYNNQGSVYVVGDVTGYYGADGG